MSSRDVLSCVGVNIKFQFSNLSDNAFGKNYPSFSHDTSRIPVSKMTSEKNPAS